MSIEHKGQAPEPQEQQAIEYEFKSVHGEKIASAVNGAVEYQKTLTGWSDNVEEPLRKSLNELFDEAILATNNSIQNLTTRDLATIAENSTPEKKRHEYEAKNKEMKEHGADFSYKNVVRNTLGLLQTKAQSVEEYKKQNKSKGKSDFHKKSSMRLKG